MAASTGAGTQSTTVDYRPHRLLSLWRSTIGKKYVAAVTGLLMAGFVIAHMAGNLKTFEGPGHGHAALDAYARYLRTIGSPVLPHNFILWMERIVLLSTVTLHVTVVSQLWSRNRAARPRDHKVQPIRSTLAARTMPYTGLLILAFVVFHVLQFTTRTIHPSKLVNGAVYANVYGAFHLWWCVVIYIAAVVLLGFHINHGLWSGAQTAGSDNPDRNWFWRRMATGVTVLTVVGFALVPLVVAFDIVPKP